jgi:hypothetical protein
MRDGHRRTKVIAACGLITSGAALMLLGHHGAHLWTLAGVATGVGVGLILVELRRRV